VLRKWVECHTCYLQTCPYDNRCVKLIDADEVIAAVKSKIGNMLDDAPSGRPLYSCLKPAAGSTA